MASLMASMFLRGARSAAGVGGGALLCYNANTNVKCFSSSLS